MTTKPDLLEYPLGEGVRAFTTTRHGGCSEGEYESFNVNGYCGDNPAHVAANREALCRELGIDGDALILPHQVHGCEVLSVDEPLLRRSPDDRSALLDGVDALVTDVPGVCVAVSTADCVPVLLCDDARRVVAAVHAGWRGTLARIVEKTVRAMADRYGSAAHTLHAVIGPCISMEAFEVGDEVYDSFAAAGFPMESIARRQGKWHIDLRAANFLQLEAAGLSLAHIRVSGHCTCCEPERFFSARRQGIASGRLCSGIMLLP